MSFNSFGFPKVSGLGNPRSNRGVNRAACWQQARGTPLHFQCLFSHPQIRGTNFPNILWPLVSGFASTSTWRCVFEHLVRFERRDTETADRSDRPEISKALTETVESSKILRQSRKTRVHCLKATSLQPKQKHQAEIHHHTYR